MTQNTLNAKGLEAARKARDAAWPMDSLEPAIHAYLEALREAAVPSEEPVAWLHEHPRHDRELSFFRLAAGDKEYGYRESPLVLASPAVAPVASELSTLRSRSDRYVFTQWLAGAYGVVSDEQHECLWQAWHQGRAPLLDALSVVPVAPVAVSVKGLEWLDKDDPAANMAAAISILGVYLIWPGNTLETPAPVTTKKYETREAAKAAAQSDFNARILSSIIPATKGGRLEALLRKARDFIEDEREHDPDNAHQNDRDSFRERNASRPNLIAEIDAALAQDTDGVAKP